MVKTLPNCALLFLLLVIGLTQCEQRDEEEVEKKSRTADIVSNIAYFHMLGCYASAGHKNPLNSLLRLSLDESLYPYAKYRAAACLSDRRLSVRHNITEVFLVSDIEKSQLNAKARERMRTDSDAFLEVNEQARLMHAAFYTDQFGLVFDNETMTEKAVVGQALDGTFRFGCDMSVCKEDGKRKAITVCHFVRGVPTPRKTITKAEAERRTKAEKTDSSSFSLFSRSLSVILFLSVSMN
ncbi:unnamed protein product [Caenorhabditis sp. 36 PRJEB53466]|nr:unnamed protein product [Caenorhabditis sp. 36 PRJEB53466]